MNKNAAMNVIRISLVTVTIGASLAVAILQSKRAAGYEIENQILRAKRDVSTGASGDIKHQQTPSTALASSMDDESKEAARIARLREAADESIRQQQEAFAIEMAKNPHFSLTRADGTSLSPEAAKTAGLDAGQQKAVNFILKKTMMEVSADFASRAMIVDAESKSANGLTVYSIPARRDRGKELRDRLDASLDSEVGQAKRKILTRNLDSNNFIAGFGAQDVRLEFSSDGETYHFVYLNPLSGEPSCFGSHPLAQFQSQFGDSFEIP